MSNFPTSRARKVALTAGALACFGLAFWVSATVSGGMAGGSKKPAADALSVSSAPLEAETLGVTSDTQPAHVDAGGPPPGWVQQESPGLKIVFYVPKKFHADTRADQYFAYLNYEAHSLKPGDQYPAGKTRIELEGKIKDKSQTIAGYLKGFTSSAANIVRKNTTVAGLPAIYETGDDPGPYALYYIDRGDSLLSLRALGSKSDLSSNQALLRKLADTIELR